MNFRYIQKSMKIFLSLSLVLALVFTNTKTVNADTTYIISPDNFINITTTDKDGITPSNANMQLTDSSGNVVASWKNNGTNVTYTSSDNMITTADGESEAEFEYDITNLHSQLPAGKVYCTTYLSCSGFTYNGTVQTRSYSYDTTYTTKQSYINIAGETLTVPAGQQLLAVDSKWSSKTVDGTLGWGYGSNSKYYHFKELAGKNTFITLPTDKTVLHCINCGGRSYTCSTYNTDITYVKRTINLSEYFSIFTDDGTYSGDSYTIDPRIDDTSSVSVIITSGGAINVVIPDANGNVDIYVCPHSSLKAAIAYILPSGGAGGTIAYAIKSIYDGKITTTCTTPAIPSTGVNVINLDAGTYYITQLDSDGSVIKKQAINVANKNGVQSFTFITEKKEVTTQATTTTTGSTETGSSQSGSSETGTSQSGSSQMGSSQAVSNRPASTQGTDEATTVANNPTASQTATNETTVLANNPITTTLVADNTTSETPDETTKTDETQTTTETASSDTTEPEYDSTAPISSETATDSNASNIMIYIIIALLILSAIVELIIYIYKKKTS